MRLTSLLPIVVCVAASTSQAQVLIPGGFVFNPGGGIDNQATVGGTVAGSDFQVYNSGGLVGGVTSIAYTGEPGNPNGGLTFGYQISNVGLDSFQSLTIPGFGSLTLNVNESAAVGTVAPVAAARSAGLGSDVTFYFGAPLTEIAQGQSSHLLLIHASSGVTFGPVTGTVFGPNGSTSVAVLGPVAVPEPMEYTAVAGLGLMGLALWRRRNA